MPGQEDGEEKVDSAPQPPKGPISPIDEPPNTTNTKTTSHENTKETESKLDKDMVFWTRAVGIFTALLVISSVLQYCAMRGQQNVMQGQLDEMQADDRPWIKTTVQFTAPINFNSPRTLTQITVTIKNVGNSPAFDVEPVAWGYVMHRNHLDPSENLFSACNIYEPSARLNQSSGYVLFPGDFMSYTRHISLQPSALKQAIFQFKGKNVVSLFIAGCVGYTSGATADAHKTGFIIQVLRTLENSDIPSRSFPFIEPAGIVPLNSVGYRTSLNNGSYAK